MCAVRDVSVLVECYGRLVRAAVAQVLGRHDDELGDEVLQQVSVALWKQMQAETTIDHPASYLYRCAVRETVRLVRRELARGQVPLGSAAEVIDCSAGPDDALRGARLRDATERVLAGLADERAAAVRAHLAGFDLDEIMRMHGWPHHKARNLIARGMSDLRAGLAAMGLP
jgi:DNA-directed RNA polymerase specialized sigma24 family protein